MEYKFESKGSLYNFQFDTIYATLRKIRESGEGIKAEIRVWLKTKDSEITIVNQHFNLLSPRSRNELFKEIEEVRESSGQKFKELNVDWYNIIKTICERTIAEFRKGAKPKYLSGSEDNAPSNFLAEPLIYEGKANMLFGAGGSLKSYWALILGMLVQNPPQDELLKIKFKQANTLYLDYEGDEEEINRRIRIIQNTFNLPKESKLLYRESRVPFIEDIDEVETIVNDYDIKFIIIDSLGIACASKDLKEIESANSLYLALRRLRITSLLITHVTKDNMRKESRNVTPFGSIFFLNFARNVREVKKVQDEDNPVANIGLFHRKNNQGNLFKPLCFTMDFTESLIINQTGVDSIVEFNAELPHKRRIYQLLVRGHLTVKDISSELKISQAIVRATLNDNPSMFIRIGKEWGVLSEIE